MDILFVNMQFFVAKRLLDMRNKFRSICANIALDMLLAQLDMQPKGCSIASFTTFVKVVNAMRSVLLYNNFSPQLKLYVMLAIFSEKKICATTMKNLFFKSCNQRL